MRGRRGPYWKQRRMGMRRLWREWRLLHEALCEYRRRGWNEERIEALIVGVGWASGMHFVSPRDYASYEHKGFWRHHVRKRVSGRPSPRPAPKGGIFRRHIP